MTTNLMFQVYGTPVPQGSKKAIHHRTTGRIIIMEDQNARVRSWRQAVKETALQAMHDIGVDGFPLTGPIFIHITFYLKRPATHYGTGRNAQVLKASAPEWPAKMPDLDKLQRASFDALTESGIWADDGQVVIAHITKAWASHNRAPGGKFEITDLDQLAATVHQAIPA